MKPDTLQMPSLYRSQGFSFVELVVVLVIVGILMAAALPAYTKWIMNSRVRTSAEAIQNGLQLAKAEAVRRNASIRFQLTSSIGNDCVLSTAGTDWVVSFDNPTGACGNALLNDSFPVSDATNNPSPRMIQRRPSREGSSNIVANSDQSAIIFSGFGRANVAANINLEPLSGGCTSFRCLRVTVTPGGQIRMCDPNLSSPDPQAC